MPSEIVISTVLRSLTLEKISLLAGLSFWTTAAIPDKGVPSVTLTDGPNGTRVVRLEGSTRAACFPAAVSIAATFDGTLAERIGEALAEGAATKGARCLLAPTVCIQRHPLGGRNFEAYSEDPLLSGSMAPPLRNHEAPDEDDVHADNTLPGTVHGLDGKPGFTLFFHDTDGNGEMTGTARTIHGRPTSSFSPIGTQISVNKVVEIVGGSVGMYRLYCGISLGDIHQMADIKVGEFSFDR